METLQGLLRSTLTEMPRTALSRTVGVVHEGVGPRKAQGGAGCHLGPCSAFRCWSLLGLPGPWGTVMTSLSLPALVLWTYGDEPRREADTKGWSLRGGTGWKVAILEALG